MLKSTLSIEAKKRDFKLLPKVSPSLDMVKENFYVFIKKNLFLFILNFYIFRNI